MIEKIKKLVENDKVEDALNLLKKNIISDKFLKQQFESRILLIKSNYNNYKTPKK